MDDSAGMKSQKIDILFKSTIARSAPLLTKAWPITRPSPLAPPVITATLPSRENEASVRLKCSPPLPWILVRASDSVSLGYSTWMEESVRACDPPWEVDPAEIFPLEIPLSACSSALVGCTRRRNMTDTARHERNLFVGWICRAFTLCKFITDCNIACVKQR